MEVAVLDSPPLTNRVTLPSDAPKPGMLPALLPSGYRAVASAIDWLFGVMSLIGGLAILATFPIVNLLSLGYLLEVSGRVAQSGRLRDGFVGVRKAAQVGSIVLGVWLLSWIPWYVSHLWRSARAIDPESSITRSWHVALVFVSILVVCQAWSACLRGGRLTSFLIPRPIHFLRSAFRRGSYYKARDAVWDFVVALRLPSYFWLGLRGFTGALLWLIVPVTMLAVASQLKPGPGVLIGGTGAVLLAFVLLHLPFLQTRLAVEDRFGAMFDTRADRRLFARAPIAFFFAILFTLAFALPLYLFKIEIIPREAAWLPSLMFVMSIFPARLFTGWAYSRGARRAERRFWLFRTLSRFALVPVVAFYVLIVYFTQYLSWYGVASLYEQHAFMVPVPFLGL